MSGVLAIFVGSFLLFLVQPLVGNTILPAFGGTATVWVIVLVTFQSLLVAGYLYAHRLVAQSKGVSNSIHLLLLLLASGWLLFAGNFYPGLLVQTSSWPIPAWGTFVSVLLLIGLPYLLLSANATLIQSLAGGDYRLYAVGNLGSLCGLLAYPFILEPYFHISRQWQIVAGGLLVYTVLVARLVGSRQQKSLLFSTDGNGGRLTVVKDPGLLVWFALGALSCFLLNSVTAHLSSDVTPLALLWTIVLVAYLLSWVIGFTGIGVKLLPVACVTSLIVACVGVWHLGFFGSKGWFIELGLGLSIVFFGGWVIHGSLYGLRPQSDRLSVYYLMISIGGAVGGLLATLILPCIFSFIVEYPLALAFVGGVAIWMLWACFVSYVPSAGCVGVPRIAIGVTIVLTVWGCVLARSDEGVVLHSERNFHGMVRVMHRWVKQTDGNGFWANVLKNGGTDHGFQLAEKDWKSRIPTMYYGPQAGGLVFERHPRRKLRKPIRAACCGLGVGSLAAYARKDDLLRFFEINPAVVHIACDTNYFTFVSGAEGRIDIVVDDARKALEKECLRAEGKYDIISVDVFSGDAIPPQMVTREAFKLYLDRLEEDGILAFHVSSWHLDIQPVIKAAAREFKLQLEGFYCAGESHTYFSSWVFLSRHKLDGLFDKVMHFKVDYSKVVDLPMPEDDWHPLTQLLSFSNR